MCVTAQSLQIPEFLSVVVYPSNYCLIESSEQLMEHKKDTALQQKAKYTLQTKHGFFCLLSDVLH